MTTTICGTCGGCGGPVIAAKTYGDVISPAKCSQCGASPLQPYGPVIPMGPAPVTPFARLMAEVTRR